MKFAHITINGVDCTSDPPLRTIATDLLKYITSPDVPNETEEILMPLRDRQGHLPRLVDIAIDMDPETGQVENISLNPVRKVP